MTRAILAGFFIGIGAAVYLTLGEDEAANLLSLIPTTAGNVIGCNFIPLLLRLGERKADG